MAFTAFPDCYLVELIYNLPSGQRAENTLYFESSTGTSTGQMNDLNDVLQTWWETEVAPYVHDGVELDFVKITDMNTDTSPSLEYLAGLAGDAAGANMPGNVTATISFKTALRGRSYRGRNYVVGLMDAAIVNDTLDAGIIAGYEAAYEALALAVDGIDLVHVVASRQHNGITYNPGTTTPVTSYRMEGTIDSQRRRLAGRGA